MSKIHIKPKDGKQVPDPFRGGYVPAEGINVDEHDVYWQRRIADGDLDHGPALDDDQEAGQVLEKKK